MSSTENSQDSLELTSSSAKRERSDYDDDEDEIVPSKMFDCKFPESDNQQPEYFFETDHVNTYLSLNSLIDTVFRLAMS